MDIHKVEEFANTEFATATAGFQSGREDLAMATPIYAAQFVVQGSTVCLVC